VVVVEVVEVAVGIVVVDSYFVVVVVAVEIVVGVVAFSFDFVIFVVQPTSKFLCLLMDFEELDEVVKDKLEVHMLPISVI
jgi:hypothetical protein